jgi:dCTP deaminase
MAAMSGSQIRRLLEHDDSERRLVVSPLLEPNEQLRDQQASIDVRLGFEFALVSSSSYGSIDELSPEAQKRDGLQLDPLYRRVYAPFGRSLVIHPHQFILGMTLEYLRLPRNVMAYVIGRSTWGRLGLIVATAIGVHPGFAGALILELRNLGETPLSLYPGQAIAQLFFHNVRKTDAPGVGQYSGVVEVVPRRASSPETYEKLKALKQRRARSLV